MIVEIRNIMRSRAYLNKVLPPIEYSTNAEVRNLSLTENLGILRKTRGSRSKRAANFYSFLFSRGELLAYIYNIFTDFYPSSSIPTGRLNLHDYLNTAFSWSDTSQGSDYWHECHNAWLEYIKINEIK